MALAILLLLVASFIVPGASQDLNCVFAAQGNVWTVGVEPPSGITGKCLPGNPILDVCYVAGVTYTAGPTSTLPGADPSMGGHIAKLGASCEPDIVAEFPQECTAIACDDSRLVFALKGEGIRSINHGGTDERIHAAIPGSFIRNIFLHVSTQTSYFVDITTHSVYAVGYVNTMGTASALGTAEGAVGVTVDSEPRPTCFIGEPSLWAHSESREGKFSIDFNHINPKRPPASDALLGSNKMLTLGVQSGREDKLVFTFSLRAEVPFVSMKFKKNDQIKLTLFDACRTPPMDYNKLLKKEDLEVDDQRFFKARWTPPPLKQFSGGEISFGNFEPSKEVKVKDLAFEVCPEYPFCFAAVDDDDSSSGMLSLNVLYEDCRVERCPIDGPFTGCSVLRQSNGYQSCLPMSGTLDRVIFHDDIRTIFDIDVAKRPATVTTISSSLDDVVGMDCYLGDGTDPCYPNPCMNGAFCSRNYSSPLEVWCFDFGTDIWTLQSLVETPGLK